MDKGKSYYRCGYWPGLPGIPLAIAKPDLQFVLLDSNGKKISFLNEVKRQLNIKNIEPIQIRVENYHPNQGFDTVISRAFSSLEQMIKWTQHLVAQDGLWLAMKGRFPDTELVRFIKHIELRDMLSRVSKESVAACLLTTRTRNNYGESHSHCQPKRWSR